MEDECLESHQMSKRSFQILVIPFFRNHDQNFQYCIFKRADESYWQAIAGGGGIEESPIQAATREVVEETGISHTAQYFQLETISSIPAYYFQDLDCSHQKPYVIPNYCFAVKVSDCKITLSAEHSQYQWVNYQTAKRLLRWDDNKTALWELNEKLLDGSL
jgi:dihydroneopterin triphosphate diphosphatase